MKEMTPQSKSIFDLLRSGNGFDNQVQPISIQIPPEITIGQARTATLAAVTNKKHLLIDAGLTDAFLNAYSVKLGTITPQNTNLSNYVIKSMSEYSQRTQLARQFIMIMESATRTYSGNPYQNVMNLATNIGLTLVNTLLTSIKATNVILTNLVNAINTGSSDATITNLANQAFTSMNSSTTQITNFTTNVPLNITNETNTINNYIQVSSDGYLAVVLPDWNDDTLKSPTLNVIASAALKALL